MLVWRKILAHGLKRLATPALHLWRIRHGLVEELALCIKSLATPALFGSTYVCEQMFSRMKHVKNKIKSSITDGHLEQCMITLLDPEIDSLVREKQSQVAH